MNILVIFTGGTIASSESNGYLSPNDATKMKLISLYKGNYAQEMIDFDIHFEMLSPYQILSENLEACYINKLVDTIFNVMSTANSYDGIIVTHGTDTLQYTAAALGLCFRNTNLPILLVSSNYILEDSRANGLDNFAAAVEYIGNKEASGVFVSYANDVFPAIIHPATKLFPHFPYSDELYSLDDLEDINLFSDNERDIDFASISLCDQSPVLYFHAMPGYTYPTLTDCTKAIIIESYHSGTLCTAGSSLKNFCEDAFSKNIPVYLVGVEDRTAYESTKEYDNLHIQVLPKCSPITAYMLAWYLYSRL